MNVERGGTITLTVAVPQPNFYPLSTARLYVSDARGRPLFSINPSSSTPTSLTFNSPVNDDWLNFVRNCDECAWNTGATYKVTVTEGDLFLEPPFKVLSQGAVTFSGDLPCPDCGGQGPPPDPPPPPPEEDDPFGEPDLGDPPVAPPVAPEAPCLPPSFVSPTPAVDTPCSGGTGGSGSGVLFNS